MVRRSGRCVVIVALSPVLVCCVGRLHGRSDPRSIDEANLIGSHVVYRRTGGSSFHLNPSPCARRESSRRPITWSVEGDAGTAMPAGGCRAAVPARAIGRVDKDAISGARPYVRRLRPLGTVRACTARILGGIFAVVQRKPDVEMERQ